MRCDLRKVRELNKKTESIILNKQKYILFNNKQGFLCWCKPKFKTFNVHETMSFLFMTCVINIYKQSLPKWVNGNGNITGL